MNLSVAIGLLDPYLEPPSHHTVLVAYVNPTRAAISDYEAAQPWSATEEPIAREALLAHGVPWLHEFASPERLSAHLENVLRVGIISDGSPAAGAPPRRPPVYHLYLALLYEASGDSARACTHARQWLDMISRSRQPGEPARTLRQLDRLGCS